MNKVINILGINIYNISKKELIENIITILINSELRYIVTPNPEIILKAIKDEELFYIINHADYSLADGMGLKFAGFLIGENIMRITGADLTLDILSLSESLKKKVLIINREDGLSDLQSIELAIKQKYPRLNFLIKNTSQDRRDWQNIISDIILFGPDIMFCLLGSPFQEKFIYHMHPSLPSLKLAIGVGGAFDFFTGKIKRAPVFLRKAGFEWLWRLSKQPARWKRIIDAIIIFPFNYAKWRFLHPFLYRKNIACLLYKIENKQKYILLVEREDESGHWQLPQGGTDNESLKTAGARELREELNCADFKLKAVYKNLYAYKFGQRKESKNYLKNIRHYGYKGQKQSLCIAEFTGLDKNIKMNFWEHSAWQWVPLAKVLDTVHACRKEATRIYLDYFLKFLG